MLKRKVLNKFVNGSMEKPLLVIIITDGMVEGEPDKLLRNVILKQVGDLKTHEKDLEGPQGMLLWFNCTNWCRTNFSKLWRISLPISGMMLGLKNWLRNLITMSHSAPTLIACVSYIFSVLVLYQLLTMMNSGKTWGWQKLYPQRHHREPKWEEVESPCKTLPRRHS